eukprot:65560_1
MGGDGGSIPGRDVLAKTKKAKKTAAQVTFGRSRLLNWTHCALTKQILQPPICCDDLGNLYNKVSVIEAMIHKTLPKPLSYIKKIKKDLIDCNITLRDNTRSINVNDEKNGGIFQCPISGLIGNGKYPFVCLRKCGCIVSQRALANVKGKQCLICGQSLSKTINEYTRIPINTSNENKEKLFKMMMQRKQQKKMDKNRKKKSNNHEEVKEEKEDKLSKKEKKKQIEKILQNEQKKTLKKDTVSGHKRVLSEAEESVNKKMKTSHVFASIFNRKQRDFNFAGGGTGF